MQEFQKSLDSIHSKASLSRNSISWWSVSTIEMDHPQKFTEYATYRSFKNSLLYIYQNLLMWKYRHEFEYINKMSNSIFWCNVERFSSAFALFTFFLFFLLSLNLLLFWTETKNLWQSFSRERFEVRSF